ncbi:MAG: GNAT family N-acetyltransferase [Anaerolineales bacterium]
MNFHFVPMNDSRARAVADWHDDVEFVFYGFDRDPEDWGELLDPRRRKERYFAVLDDFNELVGLFCFEPAGDSLELGLGLAPRYTGRGLGAGFVAAGMAFARKRCRPRRFSLKVAAFNRRAIRVYERLGFRTERTFPRETNGGEFEFVSMVREEDTN